MARHGFRLIVEHADEDLHDRGRLERRPAGEQFVEDGAQRVDVDGGAGRLAARLLGGHVVGRADEVAGLRQRAGRRGVSQEFRQAEVGDLGDVGQAASLFRDHRQAGSLSYGSQQNVPRLQIAMDNSVLVRDMDGAGQCFHQARCVAGGKRLAGQLLAQASPGDVLQPPGKAARQESRGRRPG